MGSSQHFQMTRHAVKYYILSFNYYVDVFSISERYYWWDGTLPSQQSVYDWGLRHARERGCSTADKQVRKRITTINTNLFMFSSYGDPTVSACWNTWILVKSRSYDVGHTVRNIKADHTTWDVTYGEEHVLTPCEQSKKFLFLDEDITRICFWHTGVNIATCSCYKLFINAKELGFLLPKGCRKPNYLQFPWQQIELMMMARCSRLTFDLF